MGQTLTGDGLQCGRARASAQQQARFHREDVSNRSNSSGTRYLERFVRTHSESFDRCSLSASPFTNVAGRPM